MPESYGVQSSGGDERGARGVSADTCEGLPRSGRRSRARHYGAAGAVVLLGGMSLAGVVLAPRHLAATTSSRRTEEVSRGLMPRARSSEFIAERAAHRLIGDIRLPKGGRLLERPPVGLPSAMRHPEQVPAAHLVDLGRYWVSSLPQQEAASWLQANAPRGVTLDVGSGTWGGPGFTVEEVTFGKTASGVLALEWVEESVATFGSKSVVRFDATVAYHPQRPPSETIPPGVDRVIVRAASTSRGSVTITVRRPTEIRTIERLVAAMQRSSVTSQPGGPCLGMRAVSERYRLTFSTSRGMPVAVVTGHPWSVGLDNVGMSVRGRREPALLDTGLRLGHLVARLAGATWPSPFC